MSSVSEARARQAAEMLGELFNLDVELLMSNSLPAMAQCLARQMIRNDDAIHAQTELAMLCSWSHYSPLSVAGYAKRILEETYLPILNAFVVASEELALDE